MPEIEKKTVDFMQITTNVWDNRIELITGDTRSSGLSHGTYFEIAQAEVVIAQLTKGIAMARRWHPGFYEEEAPSHAR